MEGGGDVLFGRFPIHAMKELEGMKGRCHVSEIHLGENVTSKTFFDFKKLIFCCCHKQSSAQFKTKAQEGLEEWWR